MLRCASVMIRFTQGSNLNRARKGKETQAESDKRGTGSRETTGEGEETARVPNPRQKISDMKAKTVGERASRQMSWRRKKRRDSTVDTVS